MRAAVVRSDVSGATELVVAEVPDPAPNPGEVLIEVHTSTVNFADFKQMRDWTGEPGTTLVPGHEAVGTVIACGDGVENLSVGQLVGAVTSQGSYCDLAIASADMVVPLPDDLEEGRAIGLVALGTAHNAIKLMGRLERDESVLVNAAAGGLGSTAVQVARALGAATVVGLVGSEGKAALVRQLGAHAIVTDYGKDVASDVMKIVPGGADVIVDSVGGPAVEANLACLAPFGRLVVCGHTGGAWGTVPTRDIQVKHQTVSGYRGRLLLQHRPDVVISAIAEGVELVRRGAVDVVLDGMLPLEEVAEAFRRLTKRESVGKIVLRIAG